MAIKENEDPFKEVLRCTRDAEAEDQRDNDFRINERGNLDPAEAKGNIDKRKRSNRQTMATIEI
jgi:hypothetical protein